MRDISAFDETFSRQAAEVFRDTGEITCLFLFSHAAGNKSFEFFDKVEVFHGRLQELRPRTCVIVFKTCQFPIRGIANDELIERARRDLANSAHLTVVRTSLITMGSQSWYHHFDCSNLAELEEELGDDFCWGHPVAVGPEPDWHNLDITIEAIVPNESGQIERGVY